MKRPRHQFFPPGLITERSRSRVMKDDSGGLDLSSKRLGSDQHDIRALDASGLIMIGGAATIRDRLKKYERQSGIGLIVASMSLGTLPQDLTLKNLQIFAEEVMPHFRAKAGVTVACRRTRSMSGTQRSGCSAAGPGRRCFTFTVPGGPISGSRYTTR